jgi:hydrogenase maturation protease
MTEPRILIACIGNIFLGDDGFGVEVARQLASRPLPPGVVVKDFGIRGFDLTYALLDSRDLTILVDACPRGDTPGAVYLIEPDLDALPDSGPVALDAHSMNPMSVLRTVQSMGGAGSRILLVGCEPAGFGPEEGQLGLSEAVEAAVPEAISLIEKVISEAVHEPASIDGSVKSTA